MSKVCKKNRENPVWIYNQCVGCELENLTKEIDQLKNELRNIKKERDELREWAEIALIGAKHEACKYTEDDPDVTWHCCDWTEVVDGAKRIGLE